MELDRETLKARWIEVLDDLEMKNRAAWLALFDGRIASVTETDVVLDFSDPAKMAGMHGFERATKPHFLTALEDSIERVTGQRRRVVVTADRQ